MPRRRKTRRRLPAESAPAPAEDFLAAFGAALDADFRAHGAAAIAAVRDKDPVTYLKICASLIPKPAAGEADPLDALSDEQLLARARTAAGELGLRLESQPGDAATPSKPKADR